MKRILLIVVLCAPVAAWAFFKPVRVLSPELAGPSCVSDVICTDSVSRYREAAGLYDEALNFVDTSVGEIRTRPRVIFCSSEACSRSFGLGRRSAVTIGTFGIVIGPRAWMSYYVRHEMIHHLQNERLGMLKAWREPEWFSEGMAYDLSGDPRAKLSEPFERYRSRFEHWYRRVGKKRLWAEARNL